MAYKNLLLVYGGLPAFESSLAHSVKLALHYQGWLTCVAPTGPAFLDRFGGGLDANVREMLQQASTDTFHIARDAFMAATKAASLSAKSEFLEADRIVPLQTGELARHYDLVITGLHTANDQGPNPDLLALTSGRPVLVVPPKFQAPGLADHALVAWDGKRSAARSLGDAMGILEDKGKVTVLTVGRDPHDGPIGDGILRHLEWHGIEAAHIQKPSIGKSIAAEIEDTADEVGAKLIVMGAFEHSKFTQDLLGGVTHEVMRTARVPVFMAH